MSKKTKKLSSLSTKWSSYAKKHPRRSKAIPIVLIAVLGIATILISQAATFSVSLEPELASSKTGVTTPSDATASGNSYVQFGTASTTPSTWPNASNTGWQHTGVTLTSYSGSTTISQDNTVIEGKNITSCLYITGNNVTIKKSRISCRSGQIRVVRADGSNLLLEDVEIDGQNDSADCLSGGGYWTARRASIYGCEDSMKIVSNVVLEYSYIHDLAGVGGCHCDGIQSEGGTSNATIRFNNIDVTTRAGATTTSSMAIMIGQDKGVDRNLTVEGNRLNGANNFNIYGGWSTGYAAPINMRVINNTFGPKGGTHAAMHPDVIWSGNVREGTGAVVNK